MTITTARRTRVAPGVAFGLTAFAFATTMLGTTVPTPIYPRYEQRFDFGALTVTLVFAAYAVGVLAALLVVGRASDTIGRRPVLLAAIGSAAVSSAVFVVAGHATSGGLPLLYLGRVLSGLSAGMFTGTATAALADFAGPEHRTRASVVAAVANIGGLGLGPLVSGVLVQWVTRPLQTPYELHLVLLAFALVAIVLIPESVDVVRPRRVKFERPTVPRDARGAFILAGTAGFVGFALLGSFTATGPAILALLGHHDPALTGLVVFSLFASSAVGQVSSVGLPTRPALIGGTAILTVGLLVVIASLAATSLPLLIVASVLGGVGQGISFRAALGLLTSASPPELRAAVASSFFTVAYVGISVPVVGIGIGTREWGLVHTGEAFAAILAVLALAALVSLAARKNATAGA